MFDKGSNYDLHNLSSKTMVALGICHWKMHDRGNKDIFKGDNS